MKEPGDLTLSFSGCGFLGVYHIGVCSCFSVYAPNSYGKICGASAGALTSAALLCGICLGEATSSTLALALQARSRALGPFHPSFDVVGFLQNGLRATLPADAYERCSGRLFISLTRLSDRKNVIVSEYASNDELLDALICTSFVPLWSGVFPPKFKGTYYIDGGFSDNQPLIDENTVTVSPFAGESDICPNDSSENFQHFYINNTSVQFTAGNFYRLSRAFLPPKPEVLSNMCKQGFDDALRFLQRRNLITCARHLSIKSSLGPTPSCANLLLADSDVFSGTTSDTEDAESFDGFVAKDGGYHSNESHVTFDIQDSPPTFSLHTDESLEDDSSESGQSNDEVPPYESDIDQSESECEEGHADCHECKHILQTAMVDTLPPAVIAALDRTSASVYTGRLASLYNSRCYRCASLLVAPVFLPWDFMSVTARKFVAWAPYLPSDIYWFTMELIRLLRDILRIVESKGRHHYRARFTCQLAVTDTDFDPTEGIHVEKESKTFVCETDARTHLVGFKLGTSTADEGVPEKCDTRRAMQTLDELRGSLLHREQQEELETHVTEPMSAADELTVEQPQPQPQIKSSTGALSVPSVPSTERIAAGASGLVDLDSFEEVLTQAAEMDRILAWYYTDENHQRKVVEIFKVDGASPTVSGRSSHASLHASSGSFSSTRRHGVSFASRKDDVRHHTSSSSSRTTARSSLHVPAEPQGGSYTTTASAPDSTTLSKNKTVTVSSGGILKRSKQHLSLERMADETAQSSKSGFRSHSNEDIPTSVGRASSESTVFAEQPLQSFLTSAASQNDVGSTTTMSTPSLPDDTAQTIPTLSPCSGWVLRSCVASEPDDDDTSAIESICFHGNEDETALSDADEELEKSIDSGLDDP